MKDKKPTKKGPPKNLKMKFSPCLFTICLLSIPHSSISAPGCSIAKDSSVVVLADVQGGGIGEFSDKWTRAFFSWWSAAQPDGSLVASFVSDATELRTFACVLSDTREFPELVLYVQPGGSADNASISLGTGGRDNILDFASSANGHVMGTCAGFYYMAGTYWWKNDFYPEAWMTHFFPTVEGDITEIATYPNYAPVTLDDGRTVIYWGGPTLGLNNTSSSLPPGSTLLASFDTSALSKPLPAAIRYEGKYVSALFNSPHPEAVSGVGISCDPPLPAGCITSDQQLQNWKWLAKQINDLTGKAWVIPNTL